MIDPDLKYCPKCKDEYRAEIVLCADCGVTLLKGSEMLSNKNPAQIRKDSRRGELKAGEELVVIHKGALNELKAIEKELKTENIGVLLSKEGGGSCSGSC